MEENKENVVEETTQVDNQQDPGDENVTKVDLSKPPKNFESAGNDILGGGFDLGAFEPR